MININKCSDIVILRIVATVSGKASLGNGSQQDMEEFFTTVMIELEKEVTDDDGLFSPIVKRFWGKEKIIRKYLATNDGKCAKCSLYPAVSNQNFLTLKIEVPLINASVKLSSLLYNYFSESLDEMKLRCGNCCSHITNCPQTGLCKSRPAVTQTVLTKSPSFLVIQLKRFGLQLNSKIQTDVIPDTRLTLPNEDSFELTAVTDHIGSTISSGHFISFIKSDQHWKLCNDANISNVTEASVGNKNNYVYFYRKIEITNNKEIYPAFVPQTYWQEVQSWQSVPPGCHVQTDMETGKTFAKLEVKPSALPPSLPSKTNKSKAKDKSAKHYDKQPIPTEHSKIKKKQGGNFKKELKQCDICKRKFVNLNLHKTRNNCFESDASKATVNSDNTENCSEEPNTKSVLESLCRGCNKIFKSLLCHLNSKKGTTCKECYTEKELEKPSKSKVFYEKNKDEIKKKKKAQYDANSDEIKKKKKAKYDANSDEIKKKINAQYDANSDEIKKKKKANYDANSDEIKKKKKAQYVANSDELKFKKKSHYDANSDEIKLKRKAHYELNQERIK